MNRLIKAELIKIATKPRSYIGFIAVAAIVLLIEFAMYADGKEYLSFITQALEQTFIIEGDFLNGNLVCFIILQTLIIQMPLMVALVTGDLISGEMANGTIRLLVTRPFSRNQILTAKIIAGSIYTFLLLLWLGIFALVFGLLIFGDGDLTVIKSDALVIIQSGDTLWRFLLAFGVAFISLTVVSSFSLLLSCLTDNSIGPIITTMAVIILFTIIGTLQVPVFENIKMFLFTTHMIVWRNLFDNPLDLELMYTSLGIMVLYIIGFTAASYIIFNKKDILN